MRKDQNNDRKTLLHALSKCMLQTKLTVQKGVIIFAEKNHLQFNFKVKTSFLNLNTFNKEETNINQASCLDTITLKVMLLYDIYHALRCQYILQSFQFQSMSTPASELEPFREFFSKMNKDLSGWLQNEKNTNLYLQDYKSTLRFLEEDYESSKITVNLGENCYLKAKRTTDKIIIRCKQDIYVEFTKTEAVPVVKSLIQLYEGKIKVCKTEICKIMASMREMESLIAQYQTMM